MIRTDNLFVVVILTKLYLAIGYSSENHMAAKGYYSALLIFVVWFEAVIKYHLCECMWTEKLLLHSSKNGKCRAWHRPFAFAVA